ncbi:MAG: hypothetical protein LBI33_03560 [Propionibacteriaceae bacterium]|nr:hypothetical protein [Propionibacteriaceae bacterium]
MSKQLFVEDLPVGRVLKSEGTVEVTAAEIVEFARRYDPQPAHLSDAGAAGTLFGTLAASGWHTAAMTMSLFVGLGLTGTIGSGIDLTWVTPTRPGDRLGLELRVVAVRPSRHRPSYGVVELEYDTVNQAGEVRQRTHAVILVPYRVVPPD